MNFASNVTLLSAIYHKHDRILDTSVTDHIAIDISLFKELRTPSSNCYVSLPNGQTAEIVGLGDIELNSGMMLKNALCVPKFKYNLLSISRLVKDSNISVVLCDDFFLIQDYANCQVKGFGKEAKGLYYLLNLSQYEIQHCMVQLVGKTTSSK